MSAAVQPPSQEEFQVLVETCFEEGLSIAQTLAEVRAFGRCDLREGIEKLKAAVQQSNCEQTVAMRASVLALRVPQPWDMHGDMY